MEINQKIYILIIKLIYVTWLHISVEQESRLSFDYKRGKSLSQIFASQFLNKNLIIFRGF